MQTPDITIDGLTIMNGDASAMGNLESGGGIYVASGIRAEIRNVHFVGNIASFTGGGLDITEGIVQDCAFENNRSSGASGGGLMVGPGNIRVFRIRCQDNYADSFGACVGSIRQNGSLDGIVSIGDFADSSWGSSIYAVIPGNLEIVNDVVAKANDAGLQLRLVHSGSVLTVAHLTLVDNPIGFKAIEYSSGAPTVKVYNTILDNNTLAARADGHSYTELYYISWRPEPGPGVGWEGPIWPMTWDSGDLYDGDPFFVDPANGDYSLGKDSRCRDHPKAPIIVDHDAYGASRPYGSGIDLGAYEWPSRLPVQPCTGCVARIWLPIIFGPPPGPPPAELRVWVKGTNSPNPNVVTPPGSKARWQWGVSNISGHDLVVAMQLCVTPPLSDGWQCWPAGQLPMGAWYGSTNYWDAWTGSPDHVGPFTAIWTVTSNSSGRVYTATATVQVTR